jgi:hypothetical protein
VGQNNKRKITESGEEKKREGKKTREKRTWSGGIDKKKCNIMEIEGRKKSKEIE